MKQPTLLFIVLLTISSVAQAQFDYYPGFPKLKNNTNSIHTFQKKTVVLKSDWETRHQVKKIDLQRKNTQITTSYDVLKFDEFGRLTEVSLSDDERDVKRMLYKLSYNKNGDITLFKRYGDERLEYTEELTYNDQYYIIKEKKITPYDTIVSSYKRDETGRLLDMLLTIKRSEITTIVYRNKYFYHNNKLVRIEEYNSDAVLTRVEYFEYNSEETEMEHSLIYPNESDKKEILARCKYDEDGNKRSEITYSENGNITLSFDTKGNIITKKDCNESDCYTEFNKYDENNNLIETRGEDSDYITKYTYDNRNNKIKQVTTVNGKITEERSISYNQFDMEIKRTFDNSRLSSKVWENKYEFDEKENWTKAEYPTDNQLFYEVNRTISYWEDNQDEKFQYDLKETYIPYRKGKLWGLADTSGSIVVEPQYDKIEYNHRLYNNWNTNERSLFTVEKDGKKGIITPNEVIIPPTHFKIFVNYPFIIGQGIGEDMFFSIYNMKGELFFDKRLSYFLAVRGQKANKLFSIAMADELAEKRYKQLFNLYGYNSITKKFDLILTDILDIEILKHFDKNYYDSYWKRVRVKRKTDSPNYPKWEKYDITIENGKFLVRIVEEPIPAEDEQETEEGPPPPPPSNSAKPAVPPSSNSAKPAVPPSNNSSESAPISVQEETEEISVLPQSSNSKRKKRNGGTYLYEIKEANKVKTLMSNGHLMMTINDKYKHFEIRPLITNKEEFKYKSEYFFSRNDTTYHVSDYVVIQQEGKRKRHSTLLGIITPQSMISPQFESVEGFYDSYFKQPFFIVSKRNEKTKKMEYGAIYADKTWLYPLQSDYEITNKYHFKRHYFGIKKDGKMGFVTQSNYPIIKPIYDTIEEYSDRVFIVSIDGKYGVKVMVRSYDKGVEMPVVFDDIPYKYVGFQGDVKAWLMKNEKGEILGYALPSGVLFYED